MESARREEGRAVARVIALAGALWVVIVVVGWLLTPPGIAIATGEQAASTRLEDFRTDGWNTLTLAWSLLGGTELVIGLGILIAAILLGSTRSWRMAAVPVVASILHQAVFLLAANAVDRPRPSVVQLDVAPPTASYPSGHVGSSAALYLSLALLALAIRRPWLRRLTVAVCCCVPLLVAFGRLYRGMHFLTDVTVGFVNGAVCAILGYAWYRVGQRRSRDPAFLPGAATRGLRQPAHGSTEARKP